MDNGRVLVTNAEQEEQLITFAQTIGAPLPEEDRLPVPQDNPAYDDALSLMTQQRVGKGFAIPPGQDKVMLVLHPREGSKETDRIVCTVDSASWDWVKPTLKMGLTHGAIKDANGEEMTGFSIQCLPMNSEGVQTGDPVVLAFAFSDVAALIPFREVAESTVKAQEQRRNLQRAVQKAAAKKAARAKLAAKSRRRNRR